MNNIQGSKVFVLGGAGFVGHHLTKLLIDEGCLVYVVDDLSRGSIIPYGSIHINANVANYGELQQAALKFKPDFVFNLTAVVAGVLFNMKNHLHMYKGNLDVLTTPVLVFQDTGVQGFLQTSSVCVYAPENQNPCVESNGFDGNPHEANAGYSEAKRDGERALLWSSIQHRIIVRPSNVIGAGDYYDERAHVVPALIRRVAEEAGDLELYGSKDTVREFIDATDVARGMIRAMVAGQDGEAYNLGTNGNNAVTIGELAQMIIDISGKKKSIISSDNIGDPIRWSNAGKLNVLGWESKVSLFDSLQESYKWYMDEVLES